MAAPRISVATERPSGGRALTVFAVVLWLAIATVALLRGAEYYALPLQARAYAFDHEQLKPSGTIGLGYGFIGTLMMVVGVVGYSARRRFRWMQRLGKLKL